MKKNRMLKVFILVFTLTLFSSVVFAQANNQNNQINTKNDVGTQASLAEDLVNALFTDDTHTALAPGVTQLTIDTARTAVNLLLPSPLKTKLLSLLKTADDLLLQGNLEAAKVTAATNAVNDLFTDSNHTTLKANISIDDINAAQALVDVIADPAVKAPLNALLVSAKNLLDVRNAEIAARAAVDALFTDSTHTALKVSIEQGDIDAAKVLVNGLTNVALKAELNLLIANAQIMLDTRDDEKKASDAVYALFSDEQHTTIKEDLSQEEINDAKALVDDLADGPVKAELTILITSAQSQFDGKEAEETATAIVDALFTDGSHDAIIDGLTQAAIDNATAVVNALSDGETKTQLTELVTKAKNLLDARIAQAQIVAEAQAAVDGLFTDSTHIQIKDDLIQNNIDTAKEKVELVTDPDVKASLTTLIEKAQTLLDDRNEQNTINEAAKTAVYDLFSDGSHTTIKPDLKQGDIDAAQEKVNLMQSSPLKAELNLLIASAQAQLDLQSPENIAIGVVNALFTDDSHTALIEDIEQATITNALDVVNALPNSDIKTNLLVLVNLAQSLFDQASETPEEKAARTAVNNLFNDVTHTDIKAETNQEAITAAKELVDALSEGAVKTELTELVTKAQTLLEERTATEAVNKLFTDDSHEVIEEATDQDAIDAAKALVDALDEGAVKTQLTELIVKAQALLDQRNEDDAKAAVDALFTDESHTAIKQETDQTAITQAKEKVDALKEGDVKTQLSELITKAQDLLDERIATETVDALFTDGYHVALKEETDQEDITQAKDKVDALKESDVKTQLTELITKAQALFDETSDQKAARTAVNNLFTDGSYTALKEETDQDDITQAKAKVDALDEGAVKTELTGLITTAQTLLDQRLEDEARAAVDALFTDESHTALKPDTNQDAITQAKAKVDALKESPGKTELTELITKAQDLLNERIAAEAVEALFTDSSHTALKPETNQETITQAKTLVDALKEGDVKTQLTELVARAQALWDETPDQKEARAAVNNLFTDGSYTAIKPETDQTAITQAKEKVDALDEGDVKTELTGLLVKAQDLLNERTATEAVENLFTDGSHTAIKETTDQEAINAAKALVDALKEGPVKTNLLSLIEKAQAYLDETPEEKAARIAVENLFTDDSHTAIKTETNQETIDAAKKLVDALADGIIKTELTELVVKAQDLLDERTATEAVDNLFTDGSHTAIKEETDQAAITQAKEKVDALKDGEVKDNLTILVVKAQDLLDERNATITVEGLFVDDSHTALKPNVIQITVTEAREQVNALKDGPVKTHLLELLDIAQELIDQNPPKTGDEYTFWNGKGTYWYRYTTNKKWWNWKITTPQYTTLTYFNTSKCISDDPARLNCATLDRRYDFTKDDDNKIVGQIARKWDVKELIYSYKEYNYNSSLDMLVRTYDKENRYYSNTRTKYISKEYKRLSNDRVTKKERLEYRTNTVKQRYYYFVFNSAAKPSVLDKVVYNSSGQKRTKGSSRAYFYKQAYNSKGKRTGTTRWTYNSKGKKVKKVNYKNIKY